MSPPAFTTPETGIGTISATRPTLSANQLRYLAEKADGIRGELVLVADANGKLDVVRPSDVNGCTVLANLNTEREGPGVPGTARIQLRGENNQVLGGPGTDIDKADAVFVTQSAVEKFLLPYYMRFKSPREVAEIERKAFEDENVDAIIHFPWSYLDAVSIDEVRFDGLYGIRFPKGGALDSKASRPVTIKLF